MALLGNDRVKVLQIFIQGNLQDVQTQTAVIKESFFGSIYFSFQSIAGRISGDV